MSNNNDMDSRPAQGEPKRRWRVTFKEADDGSGDVIVSLPYELCTPLSFTVGDTVRFEPGCGNTWVLSKK